MKHIKKIENFSVDTSNFDFDKYSKLLESTQNEPEVGDYAIVDVKYETDSFYVNLSNFLNNNIAKVIAKSYPPFGKLPYYDLKYDNVPIDIQGAFDVYGVRDFRLDRIFAFSKTKGELQTIVDSKKYNL